jgi:hypothetical protein
MSGPTHEHLVAARREGLEAARRFRLPFARQSWRGAAGGWQGAGAGSSIDFQDHRAYVPGDDPRHLHWAAYARTGQLTMKLYRAEVSPLVDLVVDESGSMRDDPARAVRVEALVAFCLESAARAGAPARMHAVSGGRVRALAADQVRAEGLWTQAHRQSMIDDGRRAGAAAEAAAGAEARARAGTGAVSGAEAASAAAGAATGAAVGAAAGAPRRATAGGTAAGGTGLPPWRAGAMKIWISDLLFPGEPGRSLNTMAAGGGCALVLAPTLATEAALEERGNVELVDREGGEPRRQRVDDALAGRYAAAYARHFVLWREAARRAAVGFARVPSEGALAAALAAEARAQGVVEVLA